MPINYDNMFFSVAQWALEALGACTYEDLTALGQEEEVEEAPDGNEPTLGAQLSYKWGYEATWQEVFGICGQ